MKRTLTLILILLITATVALAAPPQRRGAAPDGERGTLRGQRLAEFLALTDAQIEQAKALRQTLQTTVEPLRDQLRANREAIEAAIAANDSAKAGELVIAGHNIGQQIKAAADAFESSFSALLNADQKAKWDTLKQLRQLRRPRR